MMHTVLLVGCYGITTLVVNDAENIISLKCLTPVWYCIVPLCTPQAPKVGDIVPHTSPGDAAHVWRVLWAPSGVRGRAPTAQRFFHYFQHSGWPLLTQMQPLGDKSPWPPCIHPLWRVEGVDGACCMWRDKMENFENSRWRTAAILKMVISPYLSHEWLDFDEIWFADA